MRGNADKLGNLIKGTAIVAGVAAIGMFAALAVGAIDHSAASAATVNINGGENKIPNGGKGLNQLHQFRNNTGTKICDFLIKQEDPDLFGVDEDIISVSIVNPANTNQQLPGTDFDVDDNYDGTLQDGENNNVADPEDDKVRIKDRGNCIPPGISFVMLLQFEDPPNDNEFMLIQPTAMVGGIEFNIVGLTTVSPGVNTATVNNNNAITPNWMAHLRNTSGVDIQELAFRSPDPGVEINSAVCVPVSCEFRGSRVVTFAAPVAPDAVFDVFFEANSLSASAVTTYEIQFPPVGGTTELLVDDSATAAESTGSTGDSTLPIAAAAGGLLIALAGGGLYLRRRLVG